MTANILGFSADYKVKAGDHTWTVRERTMDDYLTALQAMDAVPVEDRPRWHNSTQEDYRNWHCTPDAATFIQMLRTGWIESVDHVEGLDGLSVNRTEQRAFVHACGGAFASVPRHLAGHPEAMLNLVRTPSDSIHGLTLILHGSFGARVNGDTCLEYARAVMRGLAWLQAEQIETAVYLVRPIELDSLSVAYVCPVRQSGQITDPERIGVCLHPSMLRRAGFAMLEHEYTMADLPGTHKATGSQGSPLDMPLDLLRQILPETYAIVSLPKVGDGDPQKAIQEAVNLKLRLEE